MGERPKVSKHHLGEIRFGPADNGPANSEVKTYFLSEEELQKYRGGNNVNKPELAEAKKLLAETNLSITEIAEKTGANKLSVRTYATKIRGKKAPDKVEKTLNNISRTEELQKQLAEQKRRTADFEAKFNHWKKEYGKLTNTHNDLAEEYKALSDEALEQNIKYSRLAKEYDQLNTDYEKLQEDNQRMLAELQDQPTTDTYEHKFNKLLDHFVKDESTKLIIKDLM